MWGVKGVYGVFREIRDGDSPTAGNSAWPGWVEGTSQMGTGEKAAAPLGWAGACQEGPDFVSLSCPDDWFRGPSHSRPGPRVWNQPGDSVEPGFKPSLNWRVFV